MTIDEGVNAMKRSSTVRRIESAPSSELGEARDRITLLASRLEDGYRRIDEAIGAGEDVDAWEEFWITLLHQYETLCDDLAAA
jgi:hypothetical protein